MESKFVFNIFWIILLSCHKGGSVCPSDSSSKYAKVGEAVKLKYNVDVNAKQTVSYDIVTSDQVKVIGIRYLNGNIFGSWNVISSVNFIGDYTTGDLSFEIPGVKKENGSVYHLEKDTVTEECITLYVLGVPEKPVITPDNNNVVGLDTILTCSSKSTTQPHSSKLSLHYTWNVDNPDVTRYVYSQTKHTLTIKSLKKTDFGKKFTCTSTESGDGVVGETSASSNAFVLVLIYGPDASTTVLSPDSVSYTRNEGDSLKDITCSGECYPSCKYSWTKSDDNTLMTNNKVLSLAQLTRAEAATYTCTVTNSNRTIRAITKAVTIIVTYGPDANTTVLSPLTSEYTKNENENLADITCSGKCFPSCAYKWIKLAATAAVEISNSKMLSLGSLDRTEAATYMCTVINPDTGRKQTKQVKVDVRYGPDLDTTTLLPTSPAYTLEEGKILPNIKCVGDCYPACRYRWTKSGNQEVGSGNILSLGTVTRKNATVYTCLVTNTQKSGYVTKNVTVNVIYPPDVSIISSTKEYIEGKSLDLICDAKGNPSTYIYSGLTQTFGDNVIHNGHSFVSGTLNIPSLQLQDTGNYTCYVNNGVKLPSGELKDSTNSTFVGVKVRPEILTDQLRFAGVTDKTAFIQVKLYSYPDIKKASFVRHDGVTITDVSDSKYEIDIYKTIVERNFYTTYVSLDGFFLNMSISNLQEDDFGKYTLVLENEIGTKNATIFLDAESVPSEPKYFVYSYEEGSHKFSWVRGFNGGHSQTFVIQTSVAGLNEWVTQTTISEKDRNQYSTNISYISPGTYTARIFAWNTEGQSEYVVLNETFTIERKDISENRESEKTAIIAATLSSVLVVIAIIGSLLFLWRRTVVSKMCQSKEPKESNHGQTTPENSYYNLSSLENTSHQLAEAETNTHYELLKGAGLLETSQTYESLQRQEDRLALYTTAQPDIAPVKTAEENKDGIYENLKLKGRDGNSSY